MPPLRSREPLPLCLSSILRLAACSVVFVALVSAGCSSPGDEGLFDDQSDDGGEGASGGAEGGRGGSGHGGDASGGDDGPSGGSGLAGNGGKSACNLAELESCDTDGDLCCPGPSGGECVPSSIQNCGGCHVTCNPTSADGCVARACACGSEPACSGDAPFCRDGGCAECRNDADCADSPGGRACLAGVCSACLEHAECDSPTAPICSELTGECVPCSSDAECSERDQERGECLNSGECAACDPVGNAGCSGEKDTCRPGIFACVECMSGAQCLPGQGCSNFDCTDCGSDADCAGNSAGAQCVQVTPGKFECKRCDPFDDAGCPAGVACMPGFVCAD